MAAISPLLHPMSKQPAPGQRITVRMRNGVTLFRCIATHVVSDSFYGIVIYHQRKPIDKAAALGWWPVVSSDLNG